MKKIFLDLIQKSKSVKIDSGKIFAYTTWFLLGIIILSYLLFSYGWYNSVISSLLSIITLVLLFLLKQDILNLHKKLCSNKQSLTNIFYIILISSLWVYFSGIGGYVSQNWDFEFRNAIFNDLINYQRPVTYILNEGKLGYLVYYLGYFLPAAGIGKIFGSAAAYAFLYIESMLFISTSLYLLMGLLKSNKKYIIIIFILFSGLDIIGSIRYGSDYNSLKTDFNSLHIERWSNLFQYPSMTTQLYWVFNQFIPLLFISLLVFFGESIFISIFLLGISFLFSPFMGLILGAYLIPILCGYSLFSKKNEGARIGDFRRLIRNPKFYFCGALSLILFVSILLYLFGNTNIASNISKDFNQIIILKNTGDMIRYFSFIFLEFLRIIILLPKEYWKNPFFALSYIILIILPIFNVFDVNLMMRGSFIPIFIIYCYLINFLETQNVISTKIVIILILIGVSSITPLLEILRPIHKKVYNKEDFRNNLKSFGIEQQQNFDRKIAEKNYISYDLMNKNYSFVFKKNKKD